MRITEDHLQDVYHAVVMVTPIFVTGKLENASVTITQMVITVKSVQGAIMAMLWMEHPMTVKPVLAPRAVLVI
jgi:hypothetical protein